MNVYNDKIISSVRRTPKVTFVKVSDRNSFRATQNQSESIRDEIYPNRISNQN